jgi:hypothetical protein
MAHCDNISRHLAPFGGEARLGLLRKKGSNAKHSGKARQINGKFWPRRFCTKFYVICAEFVPNSCRIKNKLLAGENHGNSFKHTLRRLWYKPYYRELPFKNELGFSRLHHNRPWTVDGRKKHGSRSSRALLSRSKSSSRPLLSLSSHCY